MFLVVPDSAALVNEMLFASPDGSDFAEGAMETALADMSFWRGVWVERFASVAGLRAGIARRP